MSDMVEKLREHFENTSEEEQKRIWKKVEKYSDVGPKVSEVIKSWEKSTK